MSKQLSKVIGYIYDSNGYYDQKYYFDDTPENIANFITLNKNNRCTITDGADTLILKSTIGGFIDVCPNQQYLIEELIPVLLPLQLGQKDPNEVIFHNDQSLEMVM